MSNEPDNIVLSEQREAEIRETVQSHVGDDPLMGHISGADNILLAAFAGAEHPYLGAHVHLNNLHIHLLERGYSGFTPEDAVAEGQDGKRVLELVCLQYQFNDSYASSNFLRSLRERFWTDDGKLTTWFTADHLLQKYDADNTLLHAVLTDRTLIKEMLSPEFWKDNVDDLYRLRQSVSVEGAWSEGAIVRYLQEEWRAVAKLEVRWSSASDLQTVCDALSNAKNSIEKSFQRAKFEASVDSEKIAYALEVIDASPEIQQRLAQDVSFGPVQALEVA